MSSLSLLLPKPKPIKLPDLNKPPQIQFFLNLINRNGILQHSRFSQASEADGYSLDDNARALIVAGWYYFLFGGKQFKKIIKKLIFFLKNQQTSTGEFSNYLFYSFGRRFLSHELATDGFGETVWALGFIYSLRLAGENEPLVNQLFHHCLEKIEKITSLRAKAYCLIGLENYLSSKKEKLIYQIALNLAQEISNFYKHNATSEWQWFENSLSYANAILPWSMFSAAKIFPKEEFLMIGKESFDFLSKETFQNHLPVPIGEGGWYYRNGQRALFDQQPIEAGYMVLANLKAFKITREIKYHKQALQWFSWFHGLNLVGLSLIDKKDGGCYDGLEPWKLNLNKGAESTICYLLAYLALVDNEKEHI